MKFYLDSRVSYYGMCSAMAMVLVRSGILNRGRDFQQGQIYWHVKGKFHPGGKFKADSGPDNSVSGGATPGCTRSNDLAGRSAALAPPCLLLCFGNSLNKK